MNRIDRISAILIQLQSRRVVRATDIAERFGISLRTVYRDVKTLEEAGIPIIGEAGVGYSIMDGYRLPPVMFTKEEATAFLTAEKFVEKLTDTATMKHHQSAMYKIRAVLRTADKNLLEDMDNHIAVFRTGAQRYEGAEPDALQPILNSIVSKNVIAIDYFAHHNQQQTKRCIEPVGLFYLSGYWHLIAFCRLRNDYRDFRIDRISNLRITTEQFAAKHPTLKEYTALMKKERELELVVIMVEKKMATHLNEQKYYSGFVSQTEVDDRLEMTFLTASLEGFARWFMMFADQAEIIKPDSLRQRVFKIINAITKNHAELI